MNDWLVLLLCGFLPTEIFRWLGVYFSRGIDETSAIYAWVKTVANATLAAVVAKLLLYPSGELAHVAAHWRYLALFGGLVAYYLSKQRIVVGVLVGEALLLALTYI